MFCNECGGKLRPGEKNCRNCGTPADQMESCGGFWGLSGQTQPQPQPVIQPVPRPQPSSKGEKIVPVAPASPDKSTRLVIWYGICAILVVIILAQALRLMTIGGKVEALERDLWVHENECGRERPDRNEEPEITDPGPYETTVPETTVPETTVPETTVPEATVPETRLPASSDPEPSVPESVPSTGPSEELPPETEASNAP